MSWRISSFVVYKVYVFMCCRLRGVLPTATQHSSTAGSGSESPPSRDKLRYLIEALLSVLVNRPNKELIPADLYSTVSADAAKKLFLHLCIHGSRRIQLLTGESSYLIISPIRYHF